MEESERSKNLSDDSSKLSESSSESRIATDDNDDNKSLAAKVSSLGQIPKPQADDDNSVEPIVNDLKCLMLEDTSVDSAPLHLRAIISHFKNENLTQGELFYLLVYSVALEMGFVCEKNYQNLKHTITLLPTSATFHSKNVLQLSKLKPFYSKSEDNTRFSLKLYTLVDLTDANDDKKLHSLLTGFVTGDLMIITISPIGDCEAIGFSSALPIARHVLNTHPIGMPLYSRFLKMNVFSRDLRDKIFVPMRNQQMSLLQASIFPSLDAMPAELYDNIFKFLNANHMNILANVNHNLNSLAVRSKHMNRMEEPAISDHSNSVLLELH